MFDILLHIIGEEALEIYNTFEFTEEEENSLQAILDKFTSHFQPQKRNVTFERHVFNTKVQRSGKNFDQFVKDLRNKSKTCEFGGLCDSLIKDHIVVE